MKQSSQQIFIVLFAALFGLPAQAQDKPAKPETSAKAAPVMQLRMDIQGDFTYHFVSKEGKSAAPIPMPAATNGVVALPLPAGMKPEGAALEVFDNGRGNLANIPVSVKGVTPLNESSFNFVQVLYVPVQSKGKPVVGVSVQISGHLGGSLKAATIPIILGPADNGVARFTNVAIGEPTEIIVSYGSNPPKSITEGLPYNHPADGVHHEPINVDWPDVKTIAAPAAPAAVSAAPPAAGATAPTPAPAAPIGSNPLGMLLGCVVIGSVGYGLYWAYTTGKLKTFFEKAGIETGTLATQGATAANPFTTPAKPAIQPITEGTADPFAGGGVSTAGAPPAVGGGPRLVGTMGTYAGNIFPLNAPSVVIGRDAANPIALPDDSNVSRRHVTIQANGGQFQVIDNGSSNGTFVNGVKITAQAPQPLRPGDELNIGNTRFRFEA